MLTMAVARHPRPPELVGVPIEEIMQKYLGRFRDRKPPSATVIAGARLGAPQRIVSS
jgi:hypothetical protein